MSAVIVVMATESHKQQSLSGWGTPVYSHLVGEGERMPLQLQCYWLLSLDLLISVVKERDLVQW